MSDRVREVVKQRYGKAALEVMGGGVASCCGSSSCCGGSEDPITRDLYDAVTASEVPEAALLASLGCGSPTALTELRAGEVVLDLGSGGGIDVLLSAKRVGPTGKAYGLDMTDEMLELARRNQREAGAENVEFLKGDIEAIPLPDSSVDVVISNCVINLSADKRRVFAEMFRVLKPGGRVAVSDVVMRGDMPAALRRNMELWAGCVAGALQDVEFERLLRDAGFEHVELEPTRIYGADDALALLGDAGVANEALAAGIDGRLMAAFVRARKPTRAERVA